MKKLLSFILLLFIFVDFSFAQDSSRVRYKASSVMIPMRDGSKLHTVVLAPFAPEDAPILMMRTPYGVGEKLANDTLIEMPAISYYKEGYYMVFQDIRGKNESEGKFVMHRPSLSLKDKSAIDESTDTWDTIDWLVKNLAGNNGKVGINGVSYPGWLALTATVNPHPALKASSPQAAMGDLFLGDDFHHNGAFRLSYGLEYGYSMEYDNSMGPRLDYPNFDMYDWYLRLGSLKNVNEKYFHGKIPTWNNFVEHPNYDSFWQTESPLWYATKPTVPTLHVGGYYDQEDNNGPLLMYYQMEKADKNNWNTLLMGPWNHGGWSRGKGDSLGKISFDIKTSEYFRDLEFRWFNYWLKGKGDGKFDEAYVFQTGSNVWKTYNTWPAKNTGNRKIFLSSANTLSFTAPATTTGGVHYISDPSKPVPYRQQPIEQTYGRGSRWRFWQVEDQRFVYNRPDVATFTMDTLTQDFTVTGKILAHLAVSTTASDADFIVKLIDVYPDKIAGEGYAVSGYQFPVAMEVFRARFRKSFSNPLPMTPGKPEVVEIDLHDINHVFKKGHRVMVQVQSSWFPLIDRNPQKYVPNIFEAKESDFIKATHTIYTNAKYSSYLLLPVAR